MIYRLRRCDIRLASKRYANFVCSIFLLYKIDMLTSSTRYAKTLFSRIKKGEKMSKIVLASQSPRRKEIMETAGFEFEIIVSNAEEKIEENLSPEEVAKSLSLQKAQAVAVDNPEKIVIGADTIVVLDNEILGKPKDKNDAYKMLKKLSGKAHKVYTGIAVICGEKIVNEAVSTEVEFYELSDDEIIKYIETNEPMDKAGSYGIQGRGCLLVKGIKGDYFNVVGLPIATLSKIIKEF